MGLVCRAQLIDRTREEFFIEGVKELKITILKLIIFHFLISLLIVFLAGEGFSHRSSLAISIIQLPLFAWPIWFLFLGNGWKRVFSVGAALCLSLIMAIAFLSKDENRVERRRFTTSLGQIYILQQFDFDHSKELPDKIQLEQPLPFGFVKTRKGFFPKGSSIGKILEARVSENTLEINGTLGSYKFTRDGNELRLVN